MVLIRAPLMVLFVLLAIGLFATHTSAAPTSHKCCRGYTRSVIPFQVIKGYSVQTDKELCPISAIIFHTERGKACANPALKWVMNHIDRLRKKAQKIHNRISKV